MITKLFPGGMAAERFYVNCREQGLRITYEDAFELRDKWFSTFKEMQYHSKPKKAIEQRFQNRAFNWKGSILVPASDDEDTDSLPEDAGKANKQAYSAKLINGMIRNNCSYNSAQNIQFQGLAAAGVKTAMWDLAMTGLLPRIYNFIHDEIVYGLYPDEMKERIPQIEQIMIAGMRKVTPHVKVGVETSCMLHWDKDAITFNELTWENGSPVLEEPPYIKKMLQREQERVG